ncbi:hypothetical protein ACFL2C_00225 [Patescibacteria group bacterium]
MSRTVDYEVTLGVGAPGFASSVDEVESSVRERRIPLAVNIAGSIPELAGATATAFKENCGTEPCRSVRVALDGTRFFNGIGGVRSHQGLGQKDLVRFENEFRRNLTTA